MNIGSVIEKGNEARNSLEGYERERHSMVLLGITRRTNQSQFGQCPKESIKEHYE